MTVEAAVERHVPDLKVSLERGSDPFRFALVLVIGLGCLRDPVYRAEHGVAVPWPLIRDLLAGFDGTFDTAPTPPAHSTASSPRRPRRAWSAAGTPRSSGSSLLGARRAACEARPRGIDGRKPALLAAEPRLALDVLGEQVENSALLLPVAAVAREPRGCCCGAALIASLLDHRRM